MRSLVACLSLILLVAGLPSAGCSHRSRKQKGSLKITTTALPDGQDGQKGYSATLTATGGTGSYTWSIVSGSLPPNLNLDSSTGKISGDIASNASASSPYTFTVQVTDGQQTASKQFDLVVNKATPPKADFSASPTYGNAPLTVTFTDKSAGAITQWQWDFDNDGTPDSTDRNPTYTYNDPGWYAVKLTVTGSAGSDACVKERFILVADDIWYVNANGGDDANGGTGWSDAFATIGKALSVADDYDLVLVADATYNETNLDFGGKKIYLKGVGHNTSGARPVMDCQQAGRAFYFASGETKDSVVDSFTIKNGSAGYGGAIWCENSSSPTLTNCTFSGNSADFAAGAIWCSQSSPSIINCTFSGNEAAGQEGGAIYCYNSSSPKIANCVFSGNSTAWYGGAIYCDSSAPTIINCTFSDNSAPTFNGGAIFCRNSSSPTITKCVFNNNSANWYGGATHCISGSKPTISDCTFSGNNASWGAAIFCEGSDLTLTNCTFSGNSADDGGAIYCKSSGGTITNCTFTSNTAKYDSGAIHCLDGSSPSIINCTFSDNSGENGGAIRCISSNPSIINCAFSGNNANGYGGAVDCDSSSPTVVNSTFSNNGADYGGAIDCYNSSSATISNSILWGNSAGSGGDEIFIADPGSSCTLNYSCADDTGYGGQTGNITENNCIHQDPQFVDAAGGDYHLKYTSPCIDAGDNTLVPSGVATDLDGNQRIVDGNNDGTSTVDIGAYEYQP